MLVLFLLIFRQPAPFRSRLCGHKARTVWCHRGPDVPLLTTLPVPTGSLAGWSRHRNDSRQTALRKLHIWQVVLIGTDLLLLNINPQQTILRLSEFWHNRTNANRRKILDIILWKWPFIERLLHKFYYITGPFTNIEFNFQFCTLRINNNEFALPWPKGNYCIQKYKTCPSGSYLAY